MDTYFKISINNPGVSGDSAGFIDNYHVVDYMKENGSVPPASLTASRNKERGWVRYNSIIKSLSILVNPIDVINIIKPASDVNTEATKFEFNIGYNKPSYLKTEDETASYPSGPSIESGAVVWQKPYLTDVLAIKRLIARAIITNDTETVFVYDPTQTAWGSNGASAKTGVISESLIIGRLATTLVNAEALITVTIATLT